MTFQPSLSNAVASRFEGEAGIESFIVVESEPWLDLDQQIALVEARYAQARRHLGLDADTAVFRRIFLSDVLNQAEAVRASGLVDAWGEGPVAVSIVQQPPLKGAKIALLAYHVAGAAALAKQRLSPHHVLVERNGVRHLWSAGLCAGVDRLDPDAAGEQTRTVFADLCNTLEDRGAALADNCVRTWIYVKDVDLFYPQMVRSRSDLFAHEGLTEDTHYIASTGIEGACGHRADIVAMDAYSNLDLLPAQVSYLNDFDHMCATKDYKVTFERGTRIAYADRTHLFVSGTASIDARGDVLHLGDVLAQLDRALENVEAVLNAGGADLTDLTHLIVYLRDPSDHAQVDDLLGRRFPDLPIVIVQGAVCRPDWLVEVEGSAIAIHDDPNLPSF